MAGKSENGSISSLSTKVRANDVIALEAVKQDWRAVKFAHQAGVTPARMLEAVQGRGGGAAAPGAGGTGRRASLAVPGTAGARGRRRVLLSR